MNPLELVRSPMIVDDAGRPVRRFSPVKETFTLRGERGRSGDSAIAELADRLNKHLGRGYMLIGLALPAILVALVAGLLTNSWLLAGANAVGGRGAARRIDDAAEIIGVVVGVGTMILAFIAFDRHRDRQASRVIERTLREEGRCVSCAGEVGVEAGPDGLHLCERCGARWRHPGKTAPGVRTRTDDAGVEGPSVEMPTVVDVTGRVFRVADLTMVRDRPEIDRLLGVVRERTRLPVILWMTYCTACVPLILWVHYGWFARASGVWKVLLGAYAIYLCYAMFLGLRQRFRRPPKVLTTGTHAGTLLVHEFCPACLGTLDAGDDARETRSCPSCGGQWPGPGEMPRFGFPAMTPGRCAVCRYDLSTLRPGPGRLVLCPECGARARLPRADVDSR
jgi:hypothetical protein